MHNWRALTVMLVSTTLLVSGCGRAITPHTPTTDTVTSPVASSSTVSSATSTPAPTLITGMVDIKHFSRECERVACWLPTQFEPELVELESVSQEERSPSDPLGDQVGWPLD